MDDELMLLQIPNTHQIVEDWTTLFITDIKVIDESQNCNARFPGSDDMFEYVWLGEK